MKRLFLLFMIVGCGADPIDPMPVDASLDEIDRPPLCSDLGCDENVFCTSPGSDQRCVCMGMQCRLK